MMGIIQNEFTRLSGAHNLLTGTWKRRPLLLIFAVCVLLEFVLVLLDLYVNWFRWADSSAIRRLFNITREDGLASLFAVIQTFLVALVVWLIYALEVRKPGRKVHAAGWLVLAVFFSYMVIDDGAMGHERIGSAFKHANEGIQLHSYAWQIVLAPAFVIMGLFMGGFLWQLGNHSIQRSWLIAALACLGVAMALDYVEGVEGAYRVLPDRTSWSEKMIAHFSKSLEEFLEMLGMRLLLILFLNYLGLLTEKTEIRIAKRKVQFIDRDNPSA